MDAVYVTRYFCPPPAFSEFLINGRIISFSSPSCEWQDQLIRRLSTQRCSDKRTELKVLRCSALSVSSRSSFQGHTKESVEETEENGEDEMALQTGQLSFNDDDHVRFHGKISGLHLLSVEGWKDDRLHHGGIWCVSIHLGKFS